MGTEGPSDLSVGVPPWLSALQRAAVPCLRRDAETLSLSLSLSLAVLSLLVDVTLRTAVYLLLPDNELTVRIGTHAFQN